MFATIKQIFSPKNKDLQKRILFTFAALFIFKLGTAIVVPGIDQASLGTKNMGFLELIDVMGGGALSNFSIFALGVSPYITASIIIQLLEMDIVPYLAELSKQGGTGRAKLNQITRITGIILAFIQGYMFSFTFLGNGTVMDYMLFSLVLTAGTCFVLWLGDQITAKGIGNGISMIIMAGIISSMPNMFKTAFSGFIGNSGNIMGIIMFALYVIVYLAIIIGIIYVQSAERRIAVQYSTKTVIYIIFIFAFAYFYTFMQIKPKEMAENLQKNGGYIPGVRPGEETVDYISTVLKRLTVVGAFALAIIAALPIIFGIISNLPSSVTIGGTGLLIVVGVSLETYKQLESQLVSRTYKKGRRR